MSNILLLMSGSIACEKASGLIPVFQDRGDCVRVILTQSAGHFVSSSKLLELGGEAVFADTFALNEEMQHIDLGHWADIIIIAPASANTLNKLAAGIADDMLTTTLLAAYSLNKPTLIAPAMNSRMLAHPATQASMKTLQSWGYHLLETAYGELACGEVGRGRLLEVEQLLAAIDAATKKPQPRAETTKGRLLITVGGTREAIDSVRYIGNRSSGKTASMIADHLSAAGYAVTALCAESALKPVLAEVITFVSFEDLAKQLKRQLSTENFVAVIHPAAVSDYSIEALLGADNQPLCTTGGKLSSKNSLLIQLTPNPKLLGQLRGWSKNTEIKVVGFKLTDSRDVQVQREAVGRLLSQDSIDAVVHNDLSEITEEQHSFHFYTNASANANDCNGATELSAGLQQWMEKAP
ncbi:MAG: bifunctional phosphopantothenoylcysteine decarboxylase/phosphopantothenate--cysteine ligase CoaBC [Xanthomonadales bacterium]|nr:bifunctional phosphopantothenoylcysteine decarboxylase/phosphopantothenate--cysteine ligase CoaBC [Xanthomonadales bacterium]